MRHVRALGRVSRAPGALRLRPVVPLLAGLLAQGSPSSGQAVKVLDAERGRMIVGGLEYGYGVFGNSVDHARGLLYVVESADPHVVQALSLSDGRVVATYGAGAGDGPGEVRDVVSVAPVSDGVLVADRDRVIHWDAGGRLLATWRPNHTVTSVCGLQGKPAIPTWDGAARPGPGGSMAKLPSAGWSHWDQALSREEVLASPDNWFMDVLYARIACADSVAYVQMKTSVVAYPILGDALEVAIPASFAERADPDYGKRDDGVHRPWIMDFGTDGTGRLLLIRLSLWRRDEYAAALVDPRTGRHSLIVDRAAWANARQLVGVYRDSAVVAKRPVGERTVNGVTRRALLSELEELWLHPLRDDDP